MNNATASPGRTVLNEDLIDTMHRTGHFKYLLAAIRAAGLGDAFTGPGPFTLFAPDDNAFGKLTKTALSDLLKPDNKAWLTAVLKLHLVAGHVRVAAAGDNATMLRSLQGEDLTIDLAHGLRVNHKARIVERDIEASNGVIHAIDTVLTPAVAS